MNWWSQLDQIGTAVGIITAIPVFWSWFILLGYRRRQKALIGSITRSRGDRPMALAISIARDTTTIDISNQVRAFLADQGMQMEVASLPWPVLSVDKTTDYVAELRKMRAKLIQRGVGQVHLFYMGPVVGALLAGDVFSNGAVQIYYHNQGTGNYEKWGPLTHPIV